MSYHRGANSIASALVGDQNNILPARIVDVGGAIRISVDVLAPDIDVPSDRVGDKKLTATLIAARCDGRHGAARSVVLGVAVNEAGAAIVSKMSDRHTATSAQARDFRRSGRTRSGVSCSFQLVRLSNSC